MSNLVIEVGKWYKCARGTHKAFIYHKLGHEAAVIRPYLGYVTALDGVFCKQDMWKENGEANHYDLHLIEEWKEPKKGVCYVNVYQDHNTDYAYMNRTMADDAARDMVRLACVRVEWTEGQFDD